MKNFYEKLLIMLSIIFLLNCSENAEVQRMEKNDFSLRVKKFNDFVYSEGHKGGKLRFPLYQEPKSFNPYIQPEAVPYMFEGLLNLKGDKFQKGLASKISVSDDSLSWSFEINSNAFWSDSTAVTAADILFSYEEAFKKYTEKGAYSSVLKRYKNLFTVEKSGTAIRFNFEKRPFFPEELFSLPILPEKIYSSQKNSSLDSLITVINGRKIIGSGAFILADYAPFGHLTFVRNNFYYRKDFKGIRLPYIDTLEFVMVSDLDEALSLFKEEKIDFLAADGLDLKSVGNNGFTNYEMGASLTGNVLRFNLNENNSFLSSEFIELLSFLIDRKEFSSSLLRGKAVEDFPFFRFSNSLNYKKINIKKFKTNLKELGFKPKQDSKFLEFNGNDAKLEIMVSSASGFRYQMAVKIKEILEEAGIMTEVLKLNSDELHSRISKGEWQCVLSSYDEGSRLTDAVNFWAYNGVSINYSGNDSLSVNQYRKAVLEKAGAVFLIRSKRYILASKRLANVNPSPFGGYSGDLTRLFIKESNF